MLMSIISEPASQFLTPACVMCSFDNAEVYADGNVAYLNKPD